jgi:uncharacterized protein YoxC
MSGPKPLFGPDDNKTVSLNDAQIEVAKQQPVNIPKPLDFGSAPTIQPKVVPNPGALFAEAKPSGVLIKATEIANAKFSALGPNLESAIRQMKQLLPLSITTIVQWGEPGVSQEGELITKAAGLIKEYSELRGAECIEDALAAASNTKTGFFEKLRGGGTSVLTYKPYLQVLKTQISTLLPQCDEFVEKIEKAHNRVSINLAALSSVAEAVGDIQDSSIAMAVDNRRRILTQCVQQCELTTLQLKQAKTIMVQQFSQASQLLTITIPAFETAQALKK